MVSSLFAAGAFKEVAALEYHRASMYNPAALAPAAGTDAYRLIIEVLFSLKSVAAFAALVFVDGHIITSSQDVRQKIVPRLLSRCQVCPRWGDGWGQPQNPLG